MSLFFVFSPLMLWVGPALVLLALGARWLKFGHGSYFARVRLAGVALTVMGLVPPAAYALETGSLSHATLGYGEAFAEMTFSGMSSQIIR